MKIRNNTLPRAVGPYGPVHATACDTAGMHGAASGEGRHGELRRDGRGRAAVQRGKQVFMTAGGCARCHYGVALTDINSGVLHSPAEVGQDPAYALRTATKMYRTTPLRGLWNPPQLRGPYFHDGSAGTLAQVVDHYVAVFRLSLSVQQRADLVAYLKTL